jgi:hypothetical protein
MEVGNNLEECISLLQVHQELIAKLEVFFAFVINKISIKNI